MREGKDTEERPPFKYVWLDAICSDDGPASPTTRHVLMAFARWVRPESETGWVSQSRISKQTALGKRTVQRHMQKAVQDDWLVPDGHEADVHRQSFTPRYRIAIPQECHSDAATSERHPEGATSTPAGASQRHPGGCQSDTQHAKEHERDPEPHQAARVRATPPSQGTRIPDGFALTEERLQAGLSQGLSNDEVNAEFDKFVDHWRAAVGKKGRKADWDATWRNWCRRAVEFRDRSTGSGMAATAYRTGERLRASERARQRSASATAVVAERMSQRERERQQEMLGDE